MTGSLVSDDVFDAELQDIEYANAFLLGLDIGRVAADEDTAIVRRFIHEYQISAEEQADLDELDVADAGTLRFQRQLAAFKKGFQAGCHSRPAAGIG